MIHLPDNIRVETSYQGANVSLIRTPDGLILIDAPMRPSDALAWRAAIAAQQGPVNWLVNTDHHPDHVLGNSFLPGRVVAHEGTRQHMRHAPHLPPAFQEVIHRLDPEGAALLPPDHRLRAPELTFSSRMTLWSGDTGLDLIHLPGHTPNSIIAHLPDEGIAFTGDMMCEAGFPAFIEADIQTWIASLLRLEQMGIACIVPGHGEICSLTEARAFRQRMQDLAGAVSRLIEAGQDREAVVSQIRYPDRIHTAVNGWPSYPAEFVDAVMRASIARIYDTLATAPQHGGQ